MAGTYRHAEHEHERWQTTAVLLCTGDRQHWLAVVTSEKRQGLKACS